MNIFEDTRAQYDGGAVLKENMSTRAARGARQRKVYTTHAKRVRYEICRRRRTFSQKITNCNTCIITYIIVYYVRCKCIRRVQLRLEFEHINIDTYDMTY